MLEPLNGPQIASSGLPLELLQQIEREGRALLQTLPDGVLRRTAERGLEQALTSRQNGLDQPGLAVSQPLPSAPLTPAALPPVALPLGVLPLPPATTARQRAERRVLRLFIHAPECRDPLLALPIADPACRAGLDWASNLAVAVADDQLPAALVQVAAQLPGLAGALLRQAAAPGDEVLQLLRRNPQAELQALLDGLEPVVD